MITTAQRTPSNSTDNTCSASSLTHQNAGEWGTINCACFSEPHNLLIRCLFYAAFTMPTVTLLGGVKGSVINSDMPTRDEAIDELASVNGKREEATRLGK